MLDHSGRNRKSRTPSYKRQIVTNPYQSGFTDVLTSTKVGRARWLTKRVAVALLMTGPLWLVMSGVRSQLLNSGLINTKDMAPFVGNETGTIAEYTLNVWHWDAVIFVLVLASIPNTAIGVWLLRKRPVAMA